jgi:diguanylate cyclase
MGARGAGTADGGRDLFARVGAFLAEHRLTADPGHYAFAFHVLSEPGGAIARAVAALTDGGVRLSQADLAALGGTMSDPALPPVAADAGAALHEAGRHAEGLAAMVRSLHGDTRAFERDLAASAQAFDGARDLAAIDEIARITGAMLERVRAAEQRLATATEEADDLRHRLVEAQGSARQDPLTGLPNRRALEEAFAAAATPPCLALVDVDHFKQVNDRFGHAVGDRVLTAIGRLLAERCGGQLVARFGGEEFAVLFAAGDVQAARSLLEDARRAIAAKRFRVRETAESIGSVTISAGFGMAARGETLDAALSRIDAALYAAKAAGRDAVQLAEPLQVGATYEKKVA